MEYRHPVLVFLLGFLTAGIYGLYWYIKTSSEMNKKGANIPIVLLIFIPILIIIFYFIGYNPWIQIPSAVLVILSIIITVAYGYWVWRYSQGVVKVTGARGPFVTFFILFLLSSAAC